MNWCEGRSSEGGLTYLVVLQDRFLRAVGLHCIYQNGYKVLAGSGPMEDWEYWTANSEY